MDYYSQIILTYFGMGSITVPPLTSWFFGFDSIPLLMLNDEYFYLFGQIQISQKGGQPHSDTSPRYGKYWLIIPQEYRCDDGECISLEFLCDGHLECVDASDEDKRRCRQPTEVRLVDGNNVTSGRLEV